MFPPVRPKKIESRRRYLWLYRRASTVNSVGVGMALAFCGVAIVFYDSDTTLTISFGSMLFGDFLRLLAGISWGATTVVIQTNLSGQFSQDKKHGKRMLKTIGEYKIH